MLKYIIGPLNKIVIPPKRTYVHPGPRARRMMSIIATRPAPRRQRTTLFYDAKVVSREGEGTGGGDVRKQLLRSLVKAPDPRVMFAWCS